MNETIVQDSCVKFSLPTPLPPTPAVFSFADNHIKDYFLILAKEKYNQELFYCYLFPSLILCAENSTSFSSLRHLIPVSRHVPSQLSGYSHSAHIQRNTGQIVNVQFPPERSVTDFILKIAMCRLSNSRLRKSADLTIFYKFHSTSLAPTLVQH